VAQYREANDNISDDVENAYGRELDRTMSSVDRSSRLAAYVRRVGNSLLLYVRRKTIEFDFFVLESDEVNAYSLPGGKIYITRGMIATLETEAELAGILGHEIGHVDLYHCVDRVRTKIDAWRSGESESGVDLTLREFIDRAYGEAQEFEADAYGQRLAAKAGYDPRGIIDVFLRMSDAEPPAAEGHRPVEHLLRDAVERYEATHPPFGERIERLQANRGGYRGRRNFLERRAKIEAAYPEEFSK
jgi:predicted Zn-dependent protease